MTDYMEAVELGREAYAGLVAYARRLRLLLFICGGVFLVSLTWVVVGPLFGIVTWPSAVATAYLGFWLARCAFHWGRAVAERDQCARILRNFSHGMFP